MNNVRQQGGNSCWIWEGSYPTGSQYGQTFYRGRVEKAHRASYMLFNGKITPGYDVRHICDNPRCVNPSHLITGTRKDNMQDAVKKNRQAKGESHGRSKLSESDVKSIRALYSQGASYRTLGKNYNVSHLAIRDIILGKTWRSVT